MPRKKSRTAAADPWDIKAHMKTSEGRWVMVPIIVAVFVLVGVTLIVGLLQLGNHLPTQTASVGAGLAVLLYYAYQLRESKFFLSIRNSRNNRTIRGGTGGIAANIEKNRGNVTIIQGLRPTAPPPERPYRDLPPHQRDFVVSLTEAMATGQYKTSFFAMGTIGPGWQVELTGRNGAPSTSLGGFDEPDLHALKHAGYMTLLHEKRLFGGGAMSYTGTLTAKALSSFEQMKGA